MISLPRYDRWLEPPDEYIDPDEKYCRACESHLTPSTACICGDYCAGCCPDCEEAPICESCFEYIKEQDACECGGQHCSLCHDSVAEE